MKVTVRAAAESDLSGAFDHYDAARSGLGSEFLAEFRRAMDRILAHPYAWHPLDADHRRCRLRRFPYGVIYRVDEAMDEIVVVAVQHLHRRPDAWQDRQP